MDFSIAKAGFDGLPSAGAVGGQVDAVHGVSADQLETIDVGVRASGDVLQLYGLDSVLRQDQFSRG